jgi:hypothetical protein
MVRQFVHDRFREHLNLMWIPTQILDAKDGIVSVTALSVQKVDASAPMRNRGRCTRRRSTKREPPSSSSPPNTLVNRCNHTEGRASSVMATTRNLHLNNAIGRSLHRRVHVKVTTDHMIAFHPRLEADLAPVVADHHRCLRSVTHLVAGR